MKPPPIPLLSGETADATARMLARLRAALPADRVCLPDDLTDDERAAVEVALVANPPASALARFPNLVWVQSLWAGVEQLIAAARVSKLKVARLIDPALTGAMAEAALTWTLYLHRRIPDYAAQQRKGEWRTLPWRTADECRVTVLGLGELGAACATKLHANNFSVAGWSRSRKDLPGITSFAGDEGFKAALQQTDVLIIVLPLTPATRGLLNTETLSLLPAGAALINFARGPIVDETALLQSLDSGHISHAVLDVFNTEPLPQSHAFWLHPKVTVLPHVAAPTDPQSAAEIAARNIARFRQEGVLPELVDLDSGF